MTVKIDPSRLQWPFSDREGEQGDESRLRLEAEGAQVGAAPASSVPLTASAIRLDEISQKTLKN